MKRVKKTIIGIALSISILSLTGCNVNIENTEKNTENEELVESIYLEQAEQQAEQDNYTVIAATAKDIYTALSTYLTKKAVAGESVPSDTSFDDVKDEISQYYYLDSTSYHIDDMSVDLDLSSESNGTYINKVTVTYKDITASYPEY